MLKTSKGRKNKFEALTWSMSGLPMTYVGQILGKKESTKVNYEMRKKGFTKHIVDK